jgi:acyl-CoA thioester hydrolase
MSHSGSPDGSGRPLSEYVLHRRVQFYELDSAGIVHFSTYLRYLEEAEHALWRAVGMSIAPRGSEIGYPRVAVAFDYRKPLRFEDEFDIRIRIAAMGEKSISYACVITRGETTMATGTMTIACVRVRAGEPMRSEPLPQDVRARFAVAGDAHV